MKRVGIDNALVEDHSVSLDFFDCFQGFGVARVEGVEGESALLTIHFSVLGL